MMTVDEVWEVIDREVAPLAPVFLPLPNARGCVLAEAVRADADLPAFDRSAIDGFAVPADAGPGSFRLVGEVRPGESEGRLEGPATALRIYTGSAIADGQGVVMVEDASVRGGVVETRVGASVRMVRRRGSQARAGDIVLKAGAAVTPGAVAMLATVGAVLPRVIPPPSVAHLSTGRELVAADHVPGCGMIRDSNGPLIEALLAEAGAVRVFQARVSEDSDEALGVLEGVAADVLLLSGGASVGAYDGSAEVLRRLGFTIHVAKVKSRPGKPLLFATNGRRVAFGLPGNPLSHFVCFHLFVRRALDRLAGRPPRPLHPVRCAGLPEPDPRETWWPARVTAPEGNLVAEPLPWTDSSDLTGLAPANALLRVPSRPTNGLAEAMIFGNLSA